MDASEQSRLGKTQLNRYYEQRDHLLAEMYRRATRKGINKFDPGGERALEFQRKCMEQGVPPEALQNVAYVRSARVIGQGSEFTRQQSLGTLMTTTLPMLPETGRDNLISDWIATQAGYHAVQRYYPTSQKNEQPSDQTVIATLQVGNMKDGIPAVVTGDQNHMIFANTFITAGITALASIEQGANPFEVQAFVELCGQGAAQHLQYLARDPSRKEVYQYLKGAFKKMGQQLDQLKQRTNSKRSNSNRNSRRLLNKSKRIRARLRLRNKSRTQLLRSRLKDNPLSSKWRLKTNKPGSQEKMLPRLHR